MTNLKNFAARQLSKKQMNNVKGGELWDCLLSRDGERPQPIYLDSEDYKKYKESAEANGWKLIC